MIVLGNNFGKNTRAIAKKHTAKVKLGRLDEAFHFRFQKVYKCACVVFACADGLVGNFDCAVQVFEGEHKLLVTVGCGVWQIAIFVASADTTVDTKWRKLANFLTPNVAGCFFKSSKKWVYCCVELVGYYAEIECF